MLTHNEIAEQFNSDEFYKKYPFSNEGNRFVGWYLRTFEDLTDDEVLECISDGAQDCKIDAMVLDDETSTINIFQGKFSKNRLQQDAVSEIKRAWDNLKDLSNLGERANSRLKERISDLIVFKEKHPNCTYHFSLITSNKLTDEASNVYEIDKKKMEEENITFEVIDIDNIGNKYRAYLGDFKSNISYEFDLTCMPYFKFDSPNKAYIMALPLSLAATFPGVKDEAVFSYNVRNSLGKTPVNKSIASSFDKNIGIKQGDFFYLHNGITAICTSLTEKNGKLSAENINIVNGCQSMTTLRSLSAEISEHRKDDTILFRLYEIGDNSFINQICTATNNQNAITQRDLRSIDPLILELKKKYEQKFGHNTFINKRGVKHKNLEKDTVFLEKVAMWFTAWFLLKPNKPKGFSFKDETVFKNVFEKRTASNVSNLSELIKIIDNNFIDCIPEDMKASTTFVHLYTLTIIKLIFCAVNNINLQNTLTDPSEDFLDKVIRKLSDTISLDKIKQIVKRTYSSSLKITKDTDPQFKIEKTLKSDGFITVIENKIGDIVETAESTECLKF